MSDRRKFSALKHGAFSATALLPGESAAEFEKLKQELIAEWCPNGEFEHDAVIHLANLVWRRRHLCTFRVASLVQRELQQLRHNIVTTIDLPKSDAANEFNTVFEKKCRAADAQARRHFGKELYALADMGEEATLDHLIKELAVQERLDSMIERCIKTLMLARGVKSLSIAQTSGTPTTPPNSSKAA